ncbi:DEAD/DEAH box helicase family protein, partial [Candidatus Gracilibacteria bacterium]|nr:DEAD/DEAH box helicase family protein [Candidatus Gracilibacteria bacterium]
MNSLNRKKINPQHNAISVAGKMVKHFQSRINQLDFNDERSLKLAHHFFGKRFLEGNPQYFRKRQKLAIKDLIRSIEKGQNEGLIKLPTGTGKTFLFGNIIQALGAPSIILVPRENLVDGTYEELVGSDKKKGLGFQAESVFKLYSAGKGNTIEQAKAIIGKEGLDGTLITTYQSFVSLLKQNKRLFNKLIKNVGCIISDEAHRSLGEQTQLTIDTTKSKINDNFEEDVIDIESEILAENEIQKVLKKHTLLHIDTTATPRLSKKEIEQEIISSATTGEVIEDGDLILPSQKKLGNAVTQIEGDTVKASDNSQPLDKFMFENGQLVYKKLTREYKNAKKLNGGYLPTVAFCNTTEQVEFYVQYLLKQGVKAIQCTTNKKGTNYKTPQEAERLLEKGDADVIVTCSKVGEGWDLATLRGAIWLVPSGSPARIMQGTGRIMRVLSEQDVTRIQKMSRIAKKYIRKTSKNTLLFTPEVWEYASMTNGSGGSGGNKGGVKEDKDKFTENLVGEAYTGLDIYAMHGELSPEQLQSVGIDFSYDKLKFRENYTVQELIDMNIPEEVLGSDRFWKPYAIEKNKENPDKKLPLTLIGLARLLK